MKLRKKLLTYTSLFISAASSMNAQACASCGCTLSSDWENMGFSTHAGWKMDIRYDYLNQEQLRSGTDTISPAVASTSGQEIEKYTKNQYVTLGMDYSNSPDWGLGLQIPYIDRAHSTLGTASNGYVAGPGGGQYDSHTRTIGDIKLIGRYQGFSPERKLGVQFGFKLPTGSHTLTGSSTDPTSPGPVSIDRGLQPGTGTTDAVLAVYYFDNINWDWNYFAQATMQTALTSSDSYKPGTGYNLNLGMRYQGWAGFTPQLQFNARHALHDTGASADQVSTGGTLIYLSPGVVVPLSRRASIYSFVQLPVYQDVRGLQLTPRYNASLGMRYAF